VPGPSANRYLEVWDFRSIPGQTDVRKLAYLVPWALLLKLWASASLPFDPGLFQRAVLVGLIWASEMSAYALFRVVTAPLPYREWQRRLGGLLAGVLYGFNFYSMLTIWSTLAYLMYGYAFFPFVLAMVLQALRKGPSLRWALIIALAWTLTISPAYVTTPVATTDWAAAWVVALVSLLLSKLPWRTFLRKAEFLVALTAAWAVFNLFWLAPFALLGTGELGKYQGSANLLSWNSAPLSDALRLAGYAGLGTTYKGNLELPWGVYYNNPLIVLIGFVPAGFGILAVARRRTPELLGLAALWCIALFFVKGPLPPFGWVNESLFGNYLLATAYRSTYQRFMGYAALALALLAPVGVLELPKLVDWAKVLHLRPSWTRRFPASRTTTAACLALAMLAFAYTGPLVTGSIYVNQGIVPNYRVTLPRYWSDLANWLDNQNGDFAILPYPYLVTSADTSLLFNNGTDGFLGLYPLITMASVPIAMGPGAGADLARFLANGQLPDAQALDMLNVRYVLVHMDANMAYLEGNVIWVMVPPQDLMRSLNATAGIRFVRAFGAVAVFENIRWVSSELLLFGGTSGVRFGLPSFVWNGFPGRRLARWDVQLSPIDRNVGDEVYEIPLAPAVSFDPTLDHFAAAREDSGSPVEQPLAYWVERDPSGAPLRMWVRAGHVGDDTTFHIYQGGRPLFAPDPSGVFLEFFDSFEDRSLDRFATVLGNWTFVNGTAVDGNVSAQAGPVPSALIENWTATAGVVEGWFRFDSNATMHFPLVPRDSSDRPNEWAVLLASGVWGYFDGRAHVPYPVLHKYQANAWSFVSVSFDLSRGRFWTTVDGQLLTPGGLPASDVLGVFPTSIAGVQMQNVVGGDTGLMWIDAVRFRLYSPRIVPLNLTNPMRLALNSTPMPYDFIGSSHTDIRFSLDRPPETTLVWLRGYDPGWELNVNGFPVDGASHFAAFGSWNGWTLPGNGSGSYRLIYAPQRLVSVTLDTSLLAMAGAAGYVLVGNRLSRWAWRRRREQE